MSGILLLTVILYFQFSYAINDKCASDLKVKYDKFKSNAFYKTENVAEESAVVYGLLDPLIDIIVNDFPADFISIDPNGNIEIKTDNYSNLIENYKGFIVILIILVIFAILMPIIGLIFCCCRCCGNCGGKQQNADNSVKCWTVIYVVGILIIGAIFVFGLVGTYQTNDHMEKGLLKLVPSVKTSVDDVKFYFNDVSKHIDFLLVDNYELLSVALLDRLGKTGQLVNCEIQEYIDLTTIEDALAVLTKLDEINKNLISINSANNELVNGVDNVNIDINNIKFDTTSVLSNIKSRTTPTNNNIDDILININSISIIDKSSYPILDFTDISFKLSLLFNQNILTTFQEGLDALKTIPGNIENKLHDQIGEVETAIKSTGKEIQKQSKTVSDITAKIADLISGSDYYLDEARLYINNYGVYRYLLDSIVCIMLLIIIVLIIVGLIFAMICKSPSNKKNCCNSKIGSVFLMISVTIMFVIFILLAAIIIIHMLAIIAQILVCKPLEDPNSNVIKMLDNLNLFNNEINANISSIMQKCYDNKTIYYVFNLESIIKLKDFDKYIENSGIQDQIDEVINKMADVFTINIINNNQLEALTELTESELVLNDFENIDQLLPNPLFDLATFDSLVVSLTEVKDGLPNVGFDAEKLSLMTIINNVKAVQTRHDVLAQHVKNIKINVKHVQTLLVDAGDFNQEMEHLKNELNNINKNVDNMPNYLKKIVEDYTKQILEVIQMYMNNVVESVQYDVGTCWPLASAIKGTISATCNSILHPMNGFWFSLFWCLLLFLPMIFLSIKLSSLFKAIYIPEESSTILEVPDYKMSTKPDRLEQGYNYENTPQYRSNKKSNITATRF